MEGKLFWLVALTAVHPGVGRSEEAQVDLPVQRDEFGLPTVWASSLKGADKGQGGAGAVPRRLVRGEAGAVCRGSCGLWPQARGGV
jgi:hypothetical protein